ncbi:MAG TPA: glycosyltransferase [Solirubrobacteraceae bacterium]|jgi:glycosyltransferase involved in cell wall biosynthesis
MRVQVVDPSAFTPPYDHALCSALAGLGADVELVTSRFAYEAVPDPQGYARRELFYRRALGAPGSQLRRVSKLLAHVPDMLAYRRHAAAAEVVHFQWLALQWLDARLLPDRPLVLTAHDLLPREARPGQARAQRRLYDRVGAVVVHSEYGRRLLAGLGVDPGKLHVVPHGAFEHLTRQPVEVPLPAELAQVSGPVVLFFGLLRPYKGLETLLRAWQGVSGAWHGVSGARQGVSGAWQGVSGAELWVVGRPRMDLDPLRPLLTPSVRLRPQFVSDAELPAYFRRADVVVLPYSRTDRLDQSGVLATALAFGRPSVVSDIGGLSEIAATGAAKLVAPGDPRALRDALIELLQDPGERERVAAAALAAARGPYSWPAVARRTLEVYERVRRS